MGVEGKRNTMRRRRHAAPGDTDQSTASRATPRSTAALSFGPAASITADARIMVVQDQVHLGEVLQGKQFGPVYAASSGQRRPSSTTSRTLLRRSSASA